MVGVASKDRDRAIAFQEDFDGKKHDNYDDLYRDPEIEVVYIASQPGSQSDDLAALQVGKGVLCEKPWDSIREKYKPDSMAQNKIVF